MNKPKPSLEQLYNIVFTLFVITSVNFITLGIGMIIINIRLRGVCR